MTKVYHPITGEYVDLMSIEKTALRNPDRLYRPEKWISFFDTDEARDTRLFGIEFEYNASENAARDFDAIGRSLLSFLNKSAKHVHILKDNSVRNGVEIVFSPMTYQYLTTQFNFDELFQLFKDLNLLASHDTGLHIHVGIKHTLRERNLLLRLFALSYPLWLELSKRKIIRLQDRYVSTEFFTMSDKHKKRHIENLRSIDKTGTSFVSFKDLSFDNYLVKNRYTAINFFNSNTVEFRLFNGLSEADDFKRALRFVKDFIALFDEISRTRIDDVFDLATFVKRTGSQDLLDQVTKKLHKATRLLDRDLLHYNHFYLVNTYWYPSTFSHHEPGNYIIHKQDVPLYQSYLKKIRALNPATQFHDINVIQEALNDFMIGACYELVVSEKNQIGIIPVVNTTQLVTLTKEKFKQDYILFKCFNRDLLLHLLTDEKNPVS